jgi:calcineurin-like phosphoesterase family protein
MRPDLALPTRLRWVLLVLLLAATGLAVTRLAPAEAATSTTFAANADAEVKSNLPTVNDGADQKLSICQECTLFDGGATKRGYVAFEVTGLSARVTAATLRVRVTTAGVPAITARKAAAGWDESTITWNNAPDPGATVGTLPAGGGADWYELPLAPGTVSGNGAYAFAITTASPVRLWISTKEAGAPAELVVESDGTPPVGDPVITAAGDISPRNLSGNPERTSDRVLAINATIALTLGDNQYPDGLLSDYLAFYDPTWGRFKSKTRPVPGNHEYQTPGAAGYFDYFGSLARPRGTSYYSFDLGGWHLVALDSNISRAAGSPQEEWLQADLQATTKRCILAFWHHPRFSSGTHHGGNTSVGPFWNALHEAGADVILNGHEHNYERFGRQDPTARASAAGIRQFVVGTGGVGHYGFGSPDPNSQFRDASTFGVLKLTLHAASYDWEFISAAGDVVDSGGPDTCH